MIATKASEITMCTNRITLLLIVDDRKVDLYTFCLDNCPFHFIYIFLFFTGNICKIGFCNDFPRSK